ncbi:hypothetical protein [Nostoc sp. FACHB-888]|nr:hypothetical protein [Nostoc sp. FACHB-888]MBD2248471.1 hypothetical protein [Nostoc sp. FACHB-888]
MSATRTRVRQRHGNSWTRYRKRLERRRSVIALAVAQRLVERNERHCELV